MQQICDDLEAQHAALDAIVADIDEAAWRLPTAAQGWDVADNILHISFYDSAAHLAVVDPPGFQLQMAQIVDGEVPFAELADAPGDRLLAGWRQARMALLSTLRGLDPKARIIWFGPR